MEHTEEQLQQERAQTKSAMRSKKLREKKKAYVRSLEEKVSTLEAINKHLECTVAQQAKQIKDMKAILGDNPEIIEDESTASSSVLISINTLEMQNLDDEATNFSNGSIEYPFFHDVDIVSIQENLQNLDDFNLDIPVEDIHNKEETRKFETELNDQSITAKPDN